MSSAWVGADGAWPATLGMGSNPRGTSALCTVFWAQFSQSGLGRSPRADLAGLLMRTALLPSSREGRTNRSEMGKRCLKWQVQLMEPGGPKGWAAPPASPLHWLSTQDPVAPHPLGDAAL